jgi:hypothetical protein
MVRCDAATGNDTRRRRQAEGAEYILNAVEMHIVVGDGPETPPTTVIQPSSSRAPGPAPQMATTSPGPTSPISQPCHAVGRMSVNRITWRLAGEVAVGMHVGGQQGGWNAS